MTTAQFTKGNTKLDAMKTPASNCHMYDSQQIHKYNNIMINKFIKHIMDKIKKMFLL